MQRKAGGKSHRCGGVLRGASPPADAPNRTAERGRNRASVRNDASTASPHGSFVFLCGIVSRPPCLRRAADSWRGCRWGGGTYCVGEFVGVGSFLCIVGIQQSDHHSLHFSFLLMHRAADPLRTACAELAAVLLRARPQIVGARERFLWLHGSVGWCSAGCRSF